MNHYTRYETPTEYVVLLLHVYFFPLSRYTKIKTEA